MQINRDAKKFYINYLQEKNICKFKKRKNVHKIP